MKHFNPYVAGALVTKDITMDSYIDIVLYIEDRSHVGEFLRKEYESLAVDDLEMKDYNIITFQDIYKTKQAVRITATTKNANQRDGSLVVPWMVFFQGRIED